MTLTNLFIQKDKIKRLDLLLFQIDDSEDIGFPYKLAVGDNIDILFPLSEVERFICKGVSFVIIDSAQKKYRIKPKCFNK